MKINEKQIQLNETDTYKPEACNNVKTKRNEICFIMIVSYKSIKN